MRTVLCLASLVLAITAGAAELVQFEARIRTPTDRDFIEVVQARSSADATDALQERVPRVKVLAVRSLQRQDGYEWYLARLSVNGANVMDTTLAKSLGDARRVFASRFNGGRIVSLTVLPGNAAYKLYESVIHGATKKVFRDAVFAQTESDGRRALLARYPGARISSITEVKTQAKAEAQ